MTLTRTEVIPHQAPTITLRLRSSNTAAESSITNTAEILATSEGCPRQIIRYSPRVYGMQCHLETTQQQLKTALGLFRQNHDSGHFIQSNEKFLQGNFSEINNHMILILDNLLFQHQTSKEIPCKNCSIPF